MSTINQFNYEVSQSVTGSFYAVDSIEFSFKAKASGIIDKTTQQVDLYYSADSESLSWTQFQNYPQSFGIGSSFSTKVFTTSPTSDVQAVKAIITGSVFTASNESSTTNITSTPAITIDYDDLQIASHKSITELTDDGIMVWTSPNRYIRADKDGIDIKGGIIEANTIKTDALEVYGDVAVFGDFVASANPPFDDTPLTVVSTGGTAGSSIAYSRGDHTHDLPFSTLNAVAQEGEFTNISGSSTSTGSFGRVEVEDISASGDLFATDITLEDSNGSIINLKASTGDSFIRWYDSGTAQYSLGYDNGLDKFIIATGSGLETKAAVTIDSTGDVGLGETSPISKLHVLNTDKTLTLEKSPSGYFNSFGFDGNNAYMTYYTEAASGMTLGYGASTGAPPTIDTLFLKSDGNVGIGTNDPSGILHLSSSNSTALWIESSDVSSQYAGIVFNTLRGVGEASGYGNSQLYKTGSLTEFSLDEGLVFKSNLKTWMVGDNSKIQFYSSSVNNASITPFFHADITDKMIGIGTTNPQTLLHLNGSGGNDSGLLFENAHDDVRMYFDDNNDNSDFLITYIGTAGAELELQHDGNLILNGTNGANVGIGTTSPDEKLEVLGTTSATRVGVTTTTGNAIYRMKTNVSDYSVMGKGTTNTFEIYDALSSKTPFKIYGTGSPTNNTLVLKDGNVGIGTADPSALLDVNKGDIEIDGQANATTRGLFIKHTGQTGNITSLIQDGNNSRGVLETTERAFWIKVGSAGGTSTNEDFRIYVNTILAQTINNSGSVGIGTSTPDYKLDVEGDIRATGDIIAQRYIVSSSVTHLTQSFSSGSTRFGDTGDDTHIFTGSMYISGSLNMANLPYGSSPLNMNNQRIVDADSISISDPGEGIIFNSDDGTNVVMKITDDSADNLFDITGGVDTRVGLLGKFYVSGSGNVGIGTTDPTLYYGGKGLHIENDDTAEIFIKDTAGSQFSISARSGDVLLYSGNSNPIRIGVSGDEKMRIENSGNVGIGTPSPAYKLDVVGNAAFKDSVGTSSFASGFGGYGWRIDNESGDGWGLSLDELTVRGTMNVYELMVQQVRATNGSLWVSSTGKTISASMEASPSYSLFFDTGSNIYGHGFVEGDLIRAQRYQGNTSFKSDLIVVSVSNSGSLVAITGSHETTPPSGGFDYVRIGNTSDNTRQGAVYMTADDDNAPYIDVIDGVTAHSDFNSDNNIKVRLGKLAGINDTTFGTLSGYGLYSQNVYLTGGIKATFGEIGGFGITATALSSSDQSFVVDSSNRSIRLGDNATDMTIGLSSGIFLSGSGDFRVGNPSNDQIKFESGVLQITASQINLSGSGVGINTSTFELDAVDLDISSTNKRISIGEGKIILSGSTIPVMEIDGGQISASHFFVSETGEMTASAGKIASWDINAGNLSAVDSNGGISIDADNKIITTRTGSASNTVNIRVGQISTDTYGIQGKDSTGTTIFDLGEQRNSIAGWDFDASTFSKGNITLDSSAEKITLGSGDEITLSGSGEGHLASGAINWDTSGNLDITGSVTIGADVTIAGQTEYNTLFFEDWSSYSTAQSIDGGNNPKTDGSGNGWYYYHASNYATPSLQSSVGEIQGNKALKCGDNSDDDMVWLSSNKLIPFNSHSLYELEIRVKHSEGDGTVYCGITAYQADGVTKVSTHSPAIDSFSSQHYFAMANRNVGTDWEIHKGYFKGRQGRITGGPGFQHSNILDPGVVASGSGGDDVKYFTPLVITNYAYESGSVYIDYIKVTEIDSTGTKISGDNIQTGTIKSNNWNNSTVGSLIDLNTGHLHLGGSGSVNAALSFDGSTLTVSGTISSSEGNIGGWTIDTNKLLTTGFEIADSSQTYAISSSKFQVDHTGNITASNVDLTGTISSSEGNIGGWSITNGVLQSDTTEINALSSSLLVFDSDNNERVRVGSGSLSSVTGVASNLLLNGGFEDDSDGSTTVSHFSIISTNDGITAELWNSGSVTMNVTSSAPGTGANCFEIFVSAEQGAGGGQSS